MRVFPNQEYVCGGCARLMTARDWVVSADETVMRVRVKCHSRACVNHGKEFEVDVGPLEAREVDAG